MTGDGRGRDDAVVVVVVSKSKVKKEALFWSQALAA